MKLECTEIRFWTPNAIFRKEIEREEELSADMDHCFRLAEHYQYSLTRGYESGFHKKEMDLELQNQLCTLQIGYI